MLVNVREMEAVSDEEQSKPNKYFQSEPAKLSAGDWGSFDDACPQSSYQFKDNCHYEADDCH